MNQHTKADLILVVVTMLAAGGWIFSKEALVELPPLWFIGSRFLLAGSLLVLFSWGTIKSLTWQQVSRCLLVGVIFAVALMIWVTALSRSQYVGEGAFIVSLVIVMVPGFGFLLFREKPSRAFWFSLPLALLGYAFLSLSRGIHLESSQLLFLLAAVIFAFHFILIGRLAAQLPAIPLTGIQLCVVGVLALSLSLSIESVPSHISHSIWGWWLASALIATSLRFALQTYAQGLTLASHAVMILTLEPMLTAILAALWLEERMLGLQMLGCGLIFSAVLVNRWQTIRQLIKYRV